MSHYRKIDVRIWNDAKFMSLSDDGKMTFLLLLTHPNQTMLGAMRASVASLNDHLGWLPERLSEGFREVCEKGLVKHDESTRLVWLPNFLKYNRPESPNVVKSWAKAFDLLPECAMKSLIWEDCEDFVKGMSKAFGKAFESLAKDYTESGAGTGAGTGLSTGGAKIAPAPLVSKNEVLKPESAPVEKPAPKPRKPVEAIDESQLEPSQCARAMFEKLCVVAPPKTLHLATEAIRMLAAQLCMTPHKAMLVIQRRAEHAQASGTTVNAFWFEDAGWKPMAAKEPTFVREVEPESDEDAPPEGLDVEAAQRIWPEMEKCLKREINAQSFATWIKPIKPLGTLNGELYLQIPSPDFAHVGDRYDIAKFLPASVTDIHLLPAKGYAA